jgi:putative transposase
MARARGATTSFLDRRTPVKVYRTRDQAKAEVFDYIERFYNAVPRHSTLGYLGPIEFEMKAELA